MTEHATRTFDHYISLMKWQVLSVVTICYLIIGAVVVSHQQVPERLTADIHLIHETPLSKFVSTTSDMISSETGTGTIVFASSPIMFTPTLGPWTSTSIEKGCNEDHR